MTSYGPEIQVKEPWGILSSGLAVNWTLCHQHEKRDKQIRIAEGNGFSHSQRPTYNIQHSNQTFNIQRSQKLEKPGSTAGNGVFSHPRKR